MSTEPKTGLTQWSSGATQPDLLFNAFLRFYAAAGYRPSVLDKDLTAPPTLGTGDAGKSYIVAATATGVWTGHETHIAYWDGVSWWYFTPSEGYLAWVSDEDLQYQFNGTAWVVGSSFSGGSLTTALNEAKGADIASAATTDIGAATGNFVHVTGTTTITALGTVQAGTRRIVRFAGALTLTHHATSLILPTGANITTAANDVAVFVSEGSGNWRCVGYQRANGQALASSGAVVSSVNGDTGAVLVPTPFGIACSDLTTDLTTGTNKGYFRAPFAMENLTFRASLIDASSSGSVTVDINKNGSTILSTKLTIDATEKTSTTAATPYVATSTTCVDDDEFTIDIDGAGADAKGLIVWFIGNKT